MSAPLDYRLTPAALPEPDRARFLGWLLAHLVALSATTVALLFLGNCILPAPYLLPWLELSHGWLLLFLAFVTLSVCLRPYASAIPPQFERVCLLAYSVLWTLLLLPVLQQAPSPAWVTLALLLALSFRTTEALPSLLASHTRPATAALEALAHFGASPWDAFRLTLACFRCPD